MPEFYERPGVIGRGCGRASGIRRMEAAPAGPLRSGRGAAGLRPVAAAVQRIHDSALRRALEE